MNATTPLQSPRGFAAVYAMLVTALLSGMLVMGWMMAIALSKTSTEAKLGREAHVAASSCLREFMSGGEPVTHGGTFTNGFFYRVVIAYQQSPSAGLERVVCTVLWETEAPLPADAVTAAHTLSLAASRLSP